MRVRHRLLTVMVLAGVVGSILVAVGAIALLRSAVQERARERIAAETTLLAHWVRAAEGDADLQALAVRVAATLRARVSLIAPDGTVVADSSVGLERLAQLENHLDRPEIRAAKLRGSGESLRTSSTTRVTYFYSARIVEGPGPVRYVRMALPATEVRRVQRKYAGLVVVVVLASLVVLLAVGYAAVRRLSRPVEQITEAVERSATSDFHLSLPIPHYTGEEIGRLAATVRRMQLALLEKIDELGAERELLSSVVAGMREGLLLVGPDRRIRLANAAVRHILDCDFDPVGRLLEEVVRQPSVIRDVDAALGGKGEIEESVVRLPGSDRAFQLHVTPLRGPAKGGEATALVLFFDITRLELLERVRQDFVANVSHELRTPLTSIKAFVETLLDGGLEDRQNAQKFLEIVRRHADRMGALIEDLTDLSLIETDSVLLERREVDVDEVAREVLEQLRPQAEARRIRMRLTMPSPFPLTADRRRLEQMLTNLVDNAIKFNAEGGRVEIGGAMGPEGLTVFVEDDGIGIPGDKLDKVFQRFYQIDRHRSREAGGTGLGLSIVKHLMRLHGGRVSVDSALGRGSRFTLEFPPQTRSRRIA